MKIGQETPKNEHADQNLINKECKQKKQQLKYQSLVFLSQKFQSETLIKSGSNHAEELQKKRVEHKNGKCSRAKSTLRKEESQHLFQDHEIAEKIGILRKSTYSNNLTVMSQIQEQLKMRDTLNKTVRSPTSYKPTNFYQKVNKKKKSLIWQSSPRGQSCKSVIPDKIKKFLETNYENSVITANKKDIVKTQRSVFTEIGTDVDSSDNYIEILGKRSQDPKSRTIQDRVREGHLDKRDKYRKWAAKSSMEWIGEDYHNEETIAIKEVKKPQKTKQYKTNEIKIPKNNLYISVYLRIKDKEPNSSSPKKKFQKSENHSKIMEIKKYGSRENQINGLDYFVRRQRNNAVTNHNYYCLKSKFKQRIHGEQIALNTEQDHFKGKGSLEVFLQDKGKFVNKLKIKQKKQSKSVDKIIKGSTIVIDPW